MELSEHERASQKRYEDLKHPIMESKMTETNQFFQNPLNNANGGGWLPALLGGVVGYAAGNGGIGGGKAVGGDAPASMDQLQAGINALRSEGQAGVNAIRSEGQAAALVSQIAGVKDAVIAGSQQAALAHCTLGNQIAQGVCSINTNMSNHFGDLKAQMLQQALDSERTRATELRIELSEHRNQAGHNATQVAIQNLVNQGNA